MYGAHIVVDRMLDRVGIVEGLGRILNVDTGQYWKGYTQVNVMATTPTSRTKINKAWFNGDTDIRDGSLIEDRAEKRQYLVMSVKTEYSGDRVAYYDGTVYMVNATCTISRQGSETRDAFNRVSSGRTEIASNIPAMTVPMKTATYEQEDQILDNNNLKIVVQRSTDVTRHDQIVTDAGEVYKVTVVDKASLEGLTILYAETDIR